MTEIDMIQANATWINLAYTAGEWWITITTALVVGTYFAARQIPRWLLAVILLLYFLTAFSVVFEVAEYVGMADEYGMRLAALRAANHIANADFEPIPHFGTFNNLSLYAVIVLGSLSAAGYSFVHWRNARKT